MTTPVAASLFTTFRESTLAGKRAIVTGAASGIGRCTALAFAAAGSQVAITDVQEDGLGETAAQMQALTGGGPAAVVAADLGVCDPAVDVVEPCVSALGGLTTLVNCAGSAGPVPPASWRRQPMAACGRG